MPKSSARAAEAQVLAPQPRSFPQARAHATHESLLAAARTVFSERGFDEAQTPDIAARAGVSTGTFYRYFRDKRHIFVEMIGHHLTQMHAEVAAKLTPERFVGADTREVMDVALDELFDHVRRYPRLQRVFLEMSLRDEEVERLHARFDQLGEKLIADLLELLTTRDVVPNPAAAAHVIVVAAEEVTLSRAGLRVGSPPAIDDEALRFALREMIHRFVFPASGPAPARSHRR